jgi:FkbM family methyltransferase
MSLSRKIVVAMHNPGMTKSYADWAVHRMLKIPGPYIKVQHNARIGHSWNNFSEYWSYRGLTLGPSNAISPKIADLIESKSHMIGEDSVAFDVGANIGIFTVAFAAAGYSVVHSFEPVPATFSRLEQNVASNNFESRIKLNALGIGETVGYAEIVYDWRSPATAHIVGEDAAKGTMISLTTLDHYAESTNIRRIDFLKIDTEGHETSVIRGARRLLSEKRVALILLEWCPELLAKAGSSAEELWQTITEFDYGLHMISQSGKISAQMARSDLQSIHWDNLIALPA